jgi:hypothetical protein
MPKDVYTCIKEVDTERKVTYESITPLLEKYKDTTAADTIYYWLSKYNEDPRYCDLIENIQINSVVIENCKNYFS